MAAPATEPAANAQPARAQRPAQQMAAQQPAAQQARPARAAQPAAGSDRGSDGPPAAQDGGTSGSDGAAGTGGGRGRGAGRRGNFADRLAAMTPEEREQAMQRMRARGFQFPADLQPGASAGGGRGQGAAPQRAQPAAAAARQPAPAPNAGASTFDALFGPLPPTETFGQAGLHQQGKLQRVRLRLGVSDGQQTELLQALDGTIDEGTEVVTNVIIGSVRTTTTPAGGAGFPGLETGGRRGGGFPGGGGGRGF